MELSAGLFAKSVAPIIALVGPDGTGKSSVVEALRGRMADVFALSDPRVRHWRPFVLPALRKVVFRAGPTTPATPVMPSGAIGGLLSLFRTIYYSADWFLGYYVRDRIASHRLHAVLYDRCLVDMAVDPRRYGLTSDRWVLGLWAALPKPDLTILLAGDPEQIHRRKAELSAQEIGRQLRRWRDLVHQGYVDAVVSASTKDAAFELVLDLVLEAFLRKNGWRGRIGHHAAAHRFTRTNGSVTAGRHRSPLTTSGQ